MKSGICPSIPPISPSKPWGSPRPDRGHVPVIQRLQGLERWSRRGNLWVSSRVGVASLSPSAMTGVAQLLKQAASFPSPFPGGGCMRPPGIRPPGRRERVVRALWHATNARAERSGAFSATRSETLAAGAMCSPQNNRPQQIQETPKNTHPELAPHHHYCRDTGAREINR